MIADPDEPGPPQLEMPLDLNQQTANHSEQESVDRGRQHLIHRQGARGSFSENCRRDRLSGNGSDQPSVPMVSHSGTSGSTNSEAHHPTAERVHALSLSDGQRDTPSRLRLFHVQVEGEKCPRLEAARIQPGG